MFLKAQINNLRFIIKMKDKELENNKNRFREYEEQLAKLEKNLLNKDK